MNQPKVIAFDCFGTVFDSSALPAEEIRDYVRQVRRPVWEPLSLPKSWERLHAHGDCAVGIRQLQEKYRVVTCSNLPLKMLHRMSWCSALRWDAIVPLEANQAYKPDPRAYQTVCEVMQVEPKDVLIVSAHPDGPDATGAALAGMGFQLIRQPGHPRTITELAEVL